MSLTAYSIQQIKFEYFSYIKEFGARMDQWVMGVATEPEQALLNLGVDLVEDIWMWKPALSPQAARTVLDFFATRYRVQVAPEAQRGVRPHCIYLYKTPIFSKRS